MAGVNDILLKFVTPDVFDIRNNLQKHLKDRKQFQSYIEKNIKKVPTKILKKKQINNSQQKHCIGRHCVEQRERYLNIDSRDRDHTKYPNANKYVIDVHQENFTNVVQIEIISSHFINIKQLIHGSTTLQNNLIQWYIIDDIYDGQYITYTAEITPGNYTMIELQELIETTMNSTPRINNKTNNFNISMNQLTNEIEFESHDIELLNLDPITSVAGSNELIIQYTNHNLNINDEISIENSTDVGGIPSILINTNHIVTNIIGVNSFAIELTVNATINDTNGGNLVEIKKLIESQLLFSQNNSIASILGFEEIDTLFDTNHINTLPDDVNLLGEQYIFMCSHVLQDDFSTSTHIIQDGFAKIRLSGLPFDTIFNSYVAGKKTYYNNKLDKLELLDFTFKYENGELVNFLNTEHSFVLKITELIQKVDKTDFSSKIGQYRNFHFTKLDQTFKNNDFHTSTNSSQK